VHVGSPPPLPPPCGARTCKLQMQLSAQLQHKRRGEPAGRRQLCMASCVRKKHSAAKWGAAEASLSGENPPTAAEPPGSWILSPVRAVRLP